MPELGAMQYAAGVFEHAFRREGGRRFSPWMGIATSSPVAKSLSTSLKPGAFGDIEEPYKEPAGESRSR